MRVDKFLKVSRLIKRRTVAKKACESEIIKINGKEAKPSTKVKIGDIIELTFGDSRVTTVKVLQIKEHVKKEEAEMLYEMM